MLSGKTHTILVCHGCCKLILSVSTVNSVVYMCTYTELLIAVGLGQMLLNIYTFNAVSTLNFLPVASLVVSSSGTPTHIVLLYTSFRRRIVF